MLNHHIGIQTVPSDVADQRHRPPKSQSQLQRGTRWPAVTPLTPSRSQKNGVRSKPKQSLRSDEQCIPAFLEGGRFKLVVFWKRERFSFSKNRDPLTRVVLRSGRQGLQCCMITRAGRAPLSRNSPRHLNKGSSERPGAARVANLATLSYLGGNRRPGPDLSWAGGGW